MREFDLPMLGGDATVEDALIAAIDARRSGVVVKAAPDELRVIDYDSLVRALETNVPVLEIGFEPVLKVGLESNSLSRSAESVRVEGLKFGYLDETGNWARLVSVSEGFAIPLLNASSGERCSRPGKKPGTLDRDWYHYYPPRTRQVENPGTCKFCGAPIP